MKVKRGREADEQYCARHQLKSVSKNRGECYLMAALIYLKNRKSVECFIFINEKSRESYSCSKI